MDPKFRRLKYACYSSNLTMSVVANLSPVLFLTFRSLYGISYSLLGLLILINYVTQLIVDLIFSFFSHKFDIGVVVKRTPALAVIGLLIYAVWPWLFPDAVYPGLVIGTLFFSAAAGLVEVLISPVIAAIPAPDPDREMSKLHSVYAWGVVAMIPVSTLFLHFVGGQYWQWLALIFSMVPLVGIVLFSGTQMPPMATPEKVSGALRQLKSKALWLCVAGIFLGGAAECTMAQWSSSYLERAVGLPKLWGDIFGVALFSVMLGLGRTLYAKFGRQIGRVLCLGSVGAAVCYLIAAVSPNPVIGLLACALTGFCTSMLWPGSLVAVSARFPEGGVLIYAIMAAGGDLGASVAPQLVGIITDLAIAVPGIQQIAQQLGLQPEPLGMKLGILLGMLFPLAGAVLFWRIWKEKR